MKGRFLQGETLNEKTFVRDNVSVHIFMQYTGQVAACTGNLPQFHMEVVIVDQMFDVTPVSFTFRCDDTVPVLFMYQCTNEWDIHIPGGSTIPLSRDICMTLREAQRVYASLVSAMYQYVIIPLEKRKAALKKALAF